MSVDVNWVGHMRVDGKWVCVDANLVDQMSVVGGNCVGQMSVFGGNWVGQTSDVVYPRVSVRKSGTVKVQKAEL